METIGAKALEEFADSIKVDHIQTLTVPVMILGAELYSFIHLDHFIIIIII